MSTSYDAMWEKLNLDRDSHAGLLQVLGKFYGDIKDIDVTTITEIQAYGLGARFLFPDARRERKHGKPAQHTKAHREGKITWIFCTGTSIKWP